MDMQGEQRIAAPREKVWEALNDPEVLKQCIPGCKSLDVNEEGGFDATVTAKVGPVKATFKGSVKLENINAPESYTIAGEGKGGAAGFAKGGADVSLEADGDETILRYTVKAQVGGKLAQLGGRLIDSTAKKYANDFFNTFNEVVAGGESAAEEAPAAESAPAPAEPAAAPQPTPQAEVDDGMKEGEMKPAAASATSGESEMRAEATSAAVSAVDEVKQSRKSLSPLTWTMLVVTLVLVLLLAFSMQ